MSVAANGVRRADALAIASGSAPTVRLLTPLSGDPSPIIDTALPTVTGTALPGSVVTVFANGQQQGNPVVPNDNGVFTTQLTTPLGVGTFRVDLVAVVKDASGTTVATASEVPFVLPKPVAGVSTPGLSSLDIDRLLGVNYAFRFLGGTDTLQLTDGTISFGAGTSIALVQRLYEGVLGRAGDAGGLGAFSRELAAGSSPADLARQMLDSPEYHARFGSPSDEQYVTELYRNFQHRVPDADGKASALRFLSDGNGRGDLAAVFAQSAEARTVQAGATARVWAADPAGALVTQLYGTAYGRAPDADGLAAFKAQIAAGVPGTVLAQEIVSSDEFKLDYGGYRAMFLVQSLYRDGLGRAATTTETASTTQAIARGDLAGELFRLASLPEAAAFRSPDIHPILPYIP